MTTERPDRLRPGDVWEFEAELPMKGWRKLVPQTRRWEVLWWHAGECAWELVSLDDDKHQLFLLPFTPSWHSEMTFIPPASTVEAATECLTREKQDPASPPVTLDSLGVEPGSVLRDPLACAAVRAGMPQDEFIRILLAENAQLKRDLTEALQKCYSPVLKVGP